MRPCVVSAADPGRYRRQSLTIEMTPPTLPAAAGIAESPMFAVVEVEGAVQYLGRPGNNKAE